LLRDRGVQPTSFTHWQAIDQIELERGRTLGKVRDKIADPDEFLSIAARADEMAAPT
jgi:hypothetical protein